MPFEMLEHTADVAVRLRAPDLPGLISEGVMALRSLIFEGEPESGAPRQQWRARVSGVDGEDLLVQALSEALYAMQGEGLYPVSVSVSLLPEQSAEIEMTCLRAEGAGLRWSEEIKGVTYHGVEIRQQRGGLETIVVLDV